jgi:hypothetical protein
VPLRCAVRRLSVRTRLERRVAFLFFEGVVFEARVKSIAVSFREGG